MIFVLVEDLGRSPLSLSQVKGGEKGWVQCTRVVPRNILYTFPRIPQQPTREQKTQITHRKLVYIKKNTKKVLVTELVIVMTELLTLELSEDSVER